MSGRQFNSNSYKYGFNGKEKDDETGTQDYGLRIYNPALGKFLSVDPITGDYPELTPYQFAGNTPVVAIDLDGLETALLKPDGTYTTPRDGILQQPVPPQYFEQFKMEGSVPYSGTTELLKQTFQLVFEKPMAIFTGEDWEGNKVNKLEAAITVIGNLSSGKGGTSKAGPKIKISTENKIPRSELNLPKTRGNAFTFKKDGTPVEIHHVDQKANGPHKEMHKDDHRGKGNDLVNHPKKGQTSEIDRKAFKKQKQQYWKSEFDKHKPKGAGNNKSF